MFAWTSLAAYEARADAGFHGLKWLGVFLLPPVWDACPSQGYFTGFPFIHLAMGREKDE